MTLRNFVVCEMRGIIIFLSLIYGMGVYSVFQMNTPEIRRLLTSAKNKIKARESLLKVVFCLQTNIVTGKVLVHLSVFRGNTNFGSDGTEFALQFY